MNENDKTLRERVAILEINNNRIERLIIDYEQAQKTNRELMNEIQKMNQNISILSDRVNKMYPVVKEVMQAKFYGSWTFKILAWLGGIALILISIWPKIKGFIHYLFK
jgi:hypothetical protein